MSKSFALRISLLLGGCILFLAGCMVGRETAPNQKTLLHVFAYTPLDSATAQDFDAFKQATVEMVGKIPGLRRVWIGKLREPLPAEPNRVRTLAVAMEFDDAKALAAYADNPVHKAWEQVYERVRQQGTTTLDIPGE